MNRDVTRICPTGEIGKQEVCQGDYQIPVGKKPAKESRARRFAGVGVGTMVMREQTAVTGAPGSA